MDTKEYVGKAAKNINIENSIVINLNITISQNVFVHFLPFSCSYAICLCPYIAIPSEPNNIKYVAIEIV